MQPKPKDGQKGVCADNGEEVKEAILLAALNEKKPSNTADESDSRPSPK